MKYIGIFLVLFALLASQQATSDEQQLTPEQQQYIAHAKKILSSLDRKQGTIKLPNGAASLDVPDNFYYLDPNDAETILVEAWGNPPGAGLNTQGMLFPSESTPFDQGAWGVMIEYEEDGYVSDEDADDIDYDELLAQMKEGAEEASKERVQQGYEPIELIGWAAKPFYDQASHKLHWAKEVKFGDQAIHTLNYNIRVLGRKGVLVLNFIADMNQKDLIDSQIDTVLALADFDQGSRYADFNPSIDKVATYGIGALVAGKVIAKTGILVAALVFLKKFGLLILVAIGGLLSKFFKRKAA